MRQFTCLNCGKTGSGVRSDKLFCNKRCYGQYSRKNGVVPKLDVKLCSHNAGVECNGGDCSTCGWHPDVAAARKAAIMNAN